MSWTPHLTVAAVIEHNGCFLLVEEQIDDRPVLNQPAGHVEAGESLLAAVVREVCEETAWDFEPHALVGIYRWPLPATRAAYFRFCFTGRLLRHHEDLALDPDILRTVWLTGAELAAQRHRHRSPMVSRCLADYLAGNRYPLTLLTDVDDP